MFDKIVLIIILLLSIVTLFLAFSPEKFFIKFCIDKDCPPLDRIKFLFFALFFFLIAFSLFKECFPPETIVQDGYTYVLTDEPAEHIKANGHLYVLKSDDENTDLIEGGEN